MDGPSVERVVAKISCGPVGHRLEVRFEGRLEHLSLPDHALDPSRLWEHTCAELFVAGADTTYAEWNFSPTGQSTRFDFSEYRNRTATAADVPVRVTCTRDADAVHLVAEGSLGMDDAVAASITAVVRSRDGTCAYWALAHPGPRPDFHDRAGFVLDGRLLRG